MTEYITHFKNESEQIWWVIPRGIRIEDGEFKLRPGQEFQFQNSGVKGIFSRYSKIILRDTKNPDKPDIKLYFNKKWKRPEGGWQLDIENTRRISPTQFIMLTNMTIISPYGIPITVYDIDSSSWEAEYRRLLNREPKRAVQPEYGTGRLREVAREETALKYEKRSEAELENLYKQRRENAELYVRSFIKGGGKG